MSRSVVAVGGPPGSGKSTAARAVAAELGLEYAPVGEAFRAEARARGLDLEAFGRYAEAHPEVDRDLDRRMLALAHPGTLLEGRIQGVLCRRAGIPVVAITVTADVETRARRLAGRDGQSVDAARRAIAVREASERARYRAIYGIDVDREPTDLQLDASHRRPEEVVREIVTFLRLRWGEVAP